MGVNPTIENTGGIVSFISTIILTFQAHLHIPLSYKSTSLLSQLSCGCLKPTLEKTNGVLRHEYQNFHLLNMLRWIWIVWFMFHFMDQFLFRYDNSSFLSCLQWPIHAHGPSHISAYPAPFQSSALHLLRHWLQRRHGSSRRHMQHINIGSPISLSSERSPYLTPVLPTYHRWFVNQFKK